MHVCMYVHRVYQKDRNNQIFLEIYVGLKNKKICIECFSKSYPSGHHTWIDGGGEGQL